MALKARKDHPGISFRRSVMAGDSLSDMLFGKRLGMITALISAPLEDLRKGYKLTDLAFPDLRAFADYLSGIRSASPDPLHSPVPPLSAL
jgi:histidinol phosphatase-like enzyme